MDLLLTVHRSSRVGQGTHDPWGGDWLAGWLDGPWLLRIGLFVYRLSCGKVHSPAYYHSWSGIPLGTRPFGRCRHPSRSKPDQNREDVS